MKELVIVGALALSACHVVNGNGATADNAGNSEVGNTMSAADADSPNSDGATMQDDANIQNGSVSGSPASGNSAN